MATATATKLQNFIDGEFVDPADGETEDVVNPSTGETIAEAPLSSKEDVDRAVAAARKAFETWSVTTPADRSTALLALADAIDEHGEELADIESADAGKPRHTFLDDEIPGCSDYLRFFAGAARGDGGQGGERVRREPDLDDPPRAGGRLRSDHALELPADDGDLEDRPGLRRRLHHGAEAGREHALVDLQAGRDRGRDPAARACST